MRFPTISDDRVFLASSVARKVFVLFVLCALLPLLAIAVVSYGYVTHQLEVQAKQRLRQQCKTTALLVYERLVHLEEELKKVGQIFFGAPGAAGDYPEPFQPVSRQGRGFSQVFLVDEAGRLHWLIGSAGAGQAEVFSSLSLHGEQGSLLRIVNEEGPFPSLYLVRPIDSQQPAKGWIAGRIHPSYLWGIGTEGALPTNVELTVVLADNSNSVLVSSIPGFALPSALAGLLKKKVVSGTFSHSQHQVAYLGSFWSLFLKHHFNSPDWVIVFSQARKEIMAPVASFRFYFFLLVLLAFWIILFLSVRNIRKRMVPVQQLKQAAARIADGRFDTRVQITSGDEFEELAKAFNEMAERIEKSQTLLQRAAKMSTLGQMGAGIVHEIGQPLSAMSGCLELMKLGLSPEQHAHYLDVLTRQLERLQQIVAKFRTFSRDERHQFRTIDLDRVLDSTLDLVDHQLKMKQISLDRQAAAQVAPVIGDDQQLQQVLLNLLTNAMDALEEKPPTEQRRMWIRTWTQDGKTLLSLKDNGCGIPEQIRSAIFDPFFTTKSKERGTGLGLAISASILHEHKAEIKVHSEPGTGTEFVLAFAAAAGP